MIRDSLGYREEVEVYILMRLKSFDAMIGIFPTLKSAKVYIEKDAKHNTTGHYVTQYRIIKCNLSELVESDKLDNIHSEYQAWLNSAGERVGYWVKRKRNTDSDDPITQFAHAVLAGDPIAVDAVKDILKV